MLDNEPVQDVLKPCASRHLRPQFSYDLYRRAFLNSFAIDREHELQI
jgi:hypothetical protein